MDSVKVDFCPLCRRRIDWAIERVPLQDIYIQANPAEAAPSEGHIIIELCETCGRFVRSTLHIDGFTIYSP